MKLEYRSYDLAARCSRSLRLMMCVLLATTPSTTWANPNNGVVVAGAASIQTAGNTLTVNQLTNRAIINWQGFSVGANQAANFNLPASSSAVLNRVTGANMSVIAGQLNSNGQVFLINPNGVLFGNGAQINVGGLTASTLDISNAQFMQGGDLHFRGGSAAGVINRGTINARDGNVNLIAPSVENHGVINAPLGHVNLGAGQSVLLQGAGSSLVVEATADSLDHRVVNTGTINALEAQLIANGGNVYGLAVNTQGTIRASGAVKKNGRVLLVAGGGTVNAGGTVAAANADGSGGAVTIDAGAGGTANVTALIDVASDGGRGGKVDILGDYVNLLENSQINASGLTGGGQVRIGGGYQGRDAAVRNAVAATVDAGARIRADATGAGNGGQVIVWSDDITTFAGTITARGGSQGGDGGFAEVSGKQTLNYSGVADLSVPAGSTFQTGTLLLDPTDFAIGAAEAATIAVNLSFANVVVATDSAGMQNGDVTISAPILYASGRDFAILAHGNIVADASVQNGGVGDVSLVAGWDGVTETPGGSGIVSPAAFDFANIVANPSSYGNNSGSIFIGDGTQTSGIAVGSQFGASNFAGDSMTLLAGNTTADAFAQAGFIAESSLPNFDIDGDITVALKSDLSATGGSQDRSYVQVGHAALGTGGVTTSADGDASGRISITGQGDLNFSAGDGSFGFALLGHIGNNVNGMISTTGQRDINFSASDASFGYALLGHDGWHSNGTISIMQEGELNFSGGGGSFAFAKLGHGVVISGSASGEIDIKQGGDVNFSAGTGSRAFTRLGHSADVVNGTIDIMRNGDLNFSAGSGDGSFAFAQLGHDAYVASGAISIVQEGDLNFSAGSAEDAYAKLGHTGGGSGADFSGMITVTGQGDLRFSAGAGQNAFAQLGHGDIFGISNFMGDINIARQGDIVFAAGSGVDAYAQLGHGAADSIGDLSGAINITAQNISFNGGSVNRNSYAQLGHGGNDARGDFSGDLTVMAASLDFHGGSVNDSYAQLGHGGDNADGNHSGAILVNVSGDLNFTGGGGGDASAQLGHGGNHVDGNLNGAITIYAGGDLNFAGGTDILATAQLGHGGVFTLGDHIGAINIVHAGDLNFSAGSQPGTSAQLGHGGILTTGYHSGAITITEAGGLNFSGGDEFDAYAMLGHGGPFAVGTLEGTIQVTQADELNFAAGAGASAFAQLGHGGDGADGNRRGAISITAEGELNFSGGSGLDAYAHLGHGGNFFQGDLTGSIDIAAGNLNFSGGSGDDANAQLGHGGLGAYGDLDGAINVIRANSLNFTGGSGFDAYAQLGHGGIFASGSHRGAIIVNEANALNFSGGTDLSAYAQLGHGGAWSYGLSSGAISIVRPNDVTFSGGDGIFAYAQLGHGGMASDAQNSGAIDIVQPGNVTFTGGPGVAAYAQLGHGGRGASGSHTGAISISEAGDLTCSGGRSFRSYAQLGHGGLEAGAFISGSIEITADNITLSTDSIGFESYAQLGHGDASGQAGGSRVGDIHVIVNHNVVLTGSRFHSPALLGHATLTPDGISGDLTLAVDQLNPLSDGGGRLVMNSFSAIDMGGAPNQVRIFDTRRQGTMLADGSIINGVVHNSSLPPGTLDLAGWNENVEFVSWANERWGDSPLEFTLALPSTYAAPFTFNYRGGPPADFVFIGNTVYDRFERYQLWAQTLNYLLRYPGYGGQLTYESGDRDEQVPEVTGGSSADLYGQSASSFPPQVD